MDPNAPDPAKELGVGMVGHAFMGAAHSQAWRTAPRFFDLPLHPRMRALCGRDADRVAAAAERLGWESTETDWARLVTREDIDLVDICTPGDTHVEIAVAALDAGKHVLVREAARQHGRRGRDDGRGGRAGRRARRGLDGRVHLPPCPGRRAGPPARAGGAHRGDPARAGAVPPGLARGRLGADELAAREGAGLARGRSATSAPTSSTSPSTSPATGSSTSTGCSRRSSTSARWRSRAGASCSGVAPTAPPSRSAR